MTYAPAGFLDDLAPGSAMTVSVPGADGSQVLVALIRSDDGEVFAIDDECSHGRASLGDGDVETRGPSCTIECWKHGSRFDVRTGRPLNLPATEPVATYPVRIDGEVILVSLDEDAAAADRS